VRPLVCEHLVVGAGLLGLATADHLLRRGADSVLVVERRSSPNGGRPGEVGAILRCTAPALTEAEERGRLLLTSGADYLDHDFLSEGSGYRRLGSIGETSHPSAGTAFEELTGEQAAERFPGLLSAEFSGRFHAEDGTLDTMGLLTALHARVRAQGGRVLFDAELQQLTEEEGTVRFQAGVRSGRAGRVLLAAGPRNPRLLELVGVRADWALEEVHSFRVGTPEIPGPVIRLEEPPGGSPRGVLLPRALREWDLEVSRPQSGDEEPTVDWSLLEALREEWGGRLPWLRDSDVRKARAHSRLALDPREPILTSRGGRTLAGGAFGAHGLSLFPAVAEQLAERALGEVDPLAGILEDPD